MYLEPVCAVDTGLSRTVMHSYCTCRQQTMTHHNHYLSCYDYSDGNHKAGALMVEALRCLALALAWVRGEGSWEGKSAVDVEDPGVEDVT